MGADFGKSRGEGGSYDKSLPWGGGHGYFLKPHFAAVPLILLLLNNIAVCYMCHFTITFEKNKKLLAIHYAHMCHFTITFEKNKKLLAIHYLLTKSL